MQKERTSKILAIVAICIAILGLSIAYAAFSTTLNIAGTANVKGGQWSVYFTNLQVPTEVGSGKSISADLTTDTTKFTFSVDLIKPGDSVSYTFDVKNAGKIDAKLSDITISGVTEAANKDVTYTLTKLDGSTLNVNDELAANTTETLLLTVTYNSSATTVSETDITLDLTAVLTYSQK